MPSAHNRIKEGSKQTKGPLSWRPPEGSPQHQNNEVKTASTFIFTCESHLSEASLFGQKWPVLQMSKKKKVYPSRKHIQHSQFHSLTGSRTRFPLLSHVDVFICVTQGQSDGIKRRGRDVTPGPPSRSACAETAVGALIKGN